MEITYKCLYYCCINNAVTCWNLDRIFGKVSSLYTEVGYFSFWPVSAHLFLVLPSSFPDTSYCMFRFVAYNYWLLLQRGTNWAIYLFGFGSSKERVKTCETWVVPLLQIPSEQLWHCMIFLWFHLFRPCGWFMRR